jgi:hypothetical protein
MTRYSLKQTKNHESIYFHPVTREKIKAKNITSFNIDWGAFEFLKMEQCYKYETFVSFLSELGGSLGIWLGLSVLSLLQGSVFVTEKVTEKVKDRRRKLTTAPDQPKQSNDRKFSQNPFGDGKVSDNPFAGIVPSGKPVRSINNQLNLGPKKRSTASGGSAAK